MSFISETTTYKRCADCDAFVPYNRAVIHQKAHPSHGARCINDHQTSAPGRHSHSRDGRDSQEDDHTRRSGPTRPKTPDSRAHPYHTRSFPHEKNLSRRPSSFFFDKEAPPVPQSAANPASPSRSGIYSQYVPHSRTEPSTNTASTFPGRIDPLHVTDSVELFFQNQVSGENSSQNSPPIVDFSQHAEPLSAHGSTQHSAYRATPPLPPTPSSVASGPDVDAISKSQPIRESDAQANRLSPETSFCLPSEWSEDSDEETIDEDLSEDDSAQSSTPQQTHLSQAYQPTLPSDSPRIPVNPVGTSPTAHANQAFQGSSVRSPRPSFCYKTSLNGASFAYSCPCNACIQGVVPDVSMFTND